MTEQVAWKRIEPTVERKVGHRMVVSKTFQMPDGSTAVYDTLHAEGTRYVNAVMITTDNQAVIARQFGPGPEKVFEDNAGGQVNDGETDEEAIVREAREETGYEPTGEVRKVGEYTNRYTNAVWVGFIMLECVRVSGQELDQDEFVEIDTISIDQLIANAKGGHMTDGVTVLLALDQLEKLKQGAVHETTH